MWKMEGIYTKTILHLSLIHISLQFSSACWRTLWIILEHLCYLFKQKQLILSVSLCWTICQVISSGFCVIITEEFFVLCCTDLFVWQLVTLNWLKWLCQMRWKIIRLQSGSISEDMQFYKNNLSHTKHHPVYNAVSYTHLDVYKRQIQYSAQRLMM